MNPLTELGDRLDQAEQTALHWITDAADIIAGILPIVVVVGSAALIVRHMIVVKARAERRQVTLIPSSEFDPHIQEVARYCSQLGRVRTAVNQLKQPRTTRTIRVSFISGPDGMMGQQTAAPASAFHLIKKPGFAEVETTETPLETLFGTAPAIPPPKPATTNTAEPVKSPPMIVTPSELDTSDPSKPADVEHTHREDLAEKSSSARWACLETGET